MSSTGWRNLGRGGEISPGGCKNFARGAKILPGGCKKFATPNNSAPNSVKEIVSSQDNQSRLLYARELAGKSASSLLRFSSTTESLSRPKPALLVQEISLIVAGFLLCGHQRIFE